MNAPVTAVLPAALEGVTFCYGRTPVLRGLEFSISMGELVALVGANGAGKTTLFSILLGLSQPSHGRRRFAGHTVGEVGEDFRRRIAYLGHQPQVYRRLSARENIEFFAGIRGHALDREAVEAALAEVELQGAADRLASTFSRGMLQRLALAIALVKRAELLVLDEPFTALDRRGRGQLSGILRAQQARGAAVLFASHDLDAIAETADRVVLLEGGGIVGECRRGTEDSEAFRQRLTGLLSEGASESP